MKQHIIGRFIGIGCAWTDISGNESAAYYGYADKEHNILVDENTIFPVCSVSKFVTAICIMKMQEQKLIDIDMPVNRFLRQWKLMAADGIESDADIRSLMCHTGGIIDGEEAFYGLRRGDPEISIPDILEGKTSYNNRPAREEKLHGTAFEYSDAGYCILQLMMQEVMNKSFEDIARAIIFEPLGLKSTFFMSSKNAGSFGDRMATGYDAAGAPIAGRFPLVPDMAASGLWSTPKEMLAIAKKYAASLNGEDTFLLKESAREIAKPIKGFPWAGLGAFIEADDILTSRGWGENGQCMMKINCRTREISVVLTNQDPGADQTESGIEWLVNSKFEGR